MNAGEARSIARQWMGESTAQTPGFVGAYFAGSVNTLADEAELPPGSDVDIMVVIEGSAIPEKLGKFIKRGALLEASNIAFDRLANVETLLADYQLAHAFRVPCVVADPSGRLSAVQAAVARDFAKRRYVEARCRSACDKINWYLDKIEESAPLHYQAIPFVFGTSVTALVLLIAGLRDPTVRKRYVAVRTLLAQHGRLDVYEELLSLLGVESMRRERVELRLSELAEIFDATKKVVKTPIFFASDISDAARPIIFEGSRALIEQGLHREAVFWIAVTYSRCRIILHDDAPDLIKAFDPAYRALLADLGLLTFADFTRRADEVRRYLPRLRQIADDIMGTTPGIESEEEKLA